MQTKHDVGEQVFAVLPNGGIAKVEVKNLLVDTSSNHPVRYRVSGYSDSLTEDKIISREEAMARWLMLAVNDARKLFLADMVVDTNLAAELNQARLDMEGLHVQHNHVLEQHAAELDEMRAQYEAQARAEIRELKDQFARVVEQRDEAIRKVADLMRRITELEAKSFEDLEPEAEEKEAA